MSIQEIIASGGGLLLIFMTLVQIAPVKVNPWSAIATGQHTLGRAADIVCYGKDGKIIPAEKVCCTLEDMGGIYGIGYISQNAVHVDTRAKSFKWWGDETKQGSPNISKLGYNSFHKYFNM